MPKPLVSYRPFYARTLKAKKLKKLAFLFRHWDRVLSKVSAPLAKRWHDHPFWYGERSNIGWLALAAHESGHIAIQEPSVTRSGKAGRSDLWVIRPPHMYMYDFEAKQIELSISAFAKNPLPLKLPKTIEDLLQEAIRQLKKKDKEYDAHTAIGLVFLPLYSRSKADRKELIRSINNFRTAMLTKYLKQLGADFLALHIPPYSYVQSNSLDYSGVPSPGLAIIGKIQWSASK